MNQFGATSNDGTTTAGRDFDLVIELDDRQMQSVAGGMVINLPPIEGESKKIDHKGGIY